LRGERLPSRRTEAADYRTNWLAKEWQISDQRGQFVSQTGVDVRWRAKPKETGVLSAGKRVAGAAGRNWWR